MCCGFRGGQCRCSRAPEAAGKVEAGRKMSDGSQASVGGYSEITERCLICYRERKAAIAREEWLPDTKK